MGRKEAVGLRKRSVREEWLDLREIYIFLEVWEKDYKGSTLTGVPPPISLGSNATS